MKLLQRIFCQHTWEAEGWDSVVCRKCGKATSNPALNHCLAKEEHDLLLDERSGAIKPAACD
jgi:hypothetical protein